MQRTTHTAEVQLSLEHDEESFITVHAAAERTAQASSPGFYDPGGPNEYDIHTVQVYDNYRESFRDIDKIDWECLFGVGSWNRLIKYLEEELDD